MHNFMITVVTILDFITTTHISRSVSDQYSFGISIGRYICIGGYIGLTYKENALSVSVSVSADTVFYIGSR